MWARDKKQQQIPNWTYVLEVWAWTWDIPHTNILSFHVLPVNYVSFPSILPLASLSNRNTYQETYRQWEQGQRLHLHLQLVCTPFCALKVCCTVRLAGAEVSVKLHLEKILSTSKCLMCRVTFDPTLMFLEVLVVVIRTVWGKGLRNCWWSTFSQTTINRGLSTGWEK